MSSTVALYSHSEIYDSLDFAKLQVSYNVFKVKIIEQLKVNGPCGGITPAFQVYSLVKKLDFLFQESAKIGLKKMSIIDKNKQVSSWFDQVFNVHVDARTMHRQFEETNQYQALNFKELWIEYISLLKMAFLIFPHYSWVGPTIPGFFNYPFE